MYWKRAELRYVTRRICLGLCTFFIFHISHAQAPKPEVEIPMPLGRTNALLPWKDGGCLLVGEGREKLEDDLDLYLQFVDAEGQRIRMERHGDVLQDAGNTVVGTSDGGFLAVGYTYKPTGYGRHDLYLVKYDVQGQFEWERFYGKPFRDIGFWAGEVEDGYLVAGHTKSMGKYGDYYLVKFDKLGNALWERYYQAHFVDYAYSVAPTESGLLIAGTVSGYHYASQADHHHTDADIMLVRTDEKGEELDRRFYGGPRNDFARALLPAPDGGWYIFGSTQNYGARNFDHFLMRLDASLDSLWIRTYGGPGTDYGVAMARDSAGMLYLCGSKHGEVGGVNGSLMKVDGEGRRIWEMEWGTLEGDYGEALVRDGKGGIWVGGHARKGLGIEEWMAFKLNENGSLPGGEMQERGALEPGVYTQMGKSVGGERILVRLKVY